MQEGLKDKIFLQGLDDYIGYIPIEENTYDSDLKKFLFLKKGIVQLYYCDLTNLTDLTCDNILLVNFYIKYFAGSIDCLVKSYEEYVYDQEKEDEDECY